jgi:hypothetical protein
MTHHHTNAATSDGTVYNKPVQAPEINADAGLTAVLLLAGVLAVLVGKRKA